MYELVPFAVETTLSYLHRVPALECQRETDVRTVKPSSAALSFGEVALFRIFGKATFDSEDPKTHQVAQWRWRFFGSRLKKTTGSSDLNVSPPSDGLTKRRQCFSAAATSSGSARVQDRPPTWWKRH